MYQLVETKMTLSLEKKTLIGFMKEKRHMNQLFTRPLTTEKNQNQNTATLNLLSFLLAYKSWFMWHVSNCLTETNNLEICWQKGCK